MRGFSFWASFITGGFGDFRGLNVGGWCESAGMTEPMETPDGEAYLAAIAGIVADIEDIGVEFARVKIRELRALAAAGRLADAQGAPRNARVQVHDMMLRSISAEVAGVMRLTDRAVQRRIGEARTIIEGFPAAVAAWEAGWIVQGHVKAIVDAGLNLPAEMWAEFEKVAIERCERETPNRVRGELEILAHRMHPRSFAERHEEASAGRCVRLMPGRDGMSDLIATLPTVIAEGIHDRLTQQARAIIDTRAERASGEDADVVATDARSTDQVRADVFADLLLAGSPALADTRDTTAGPLGAIRARCRFLCPPRPSPVRTTGRAISRADPRLTPRPPARSPGRRTSGNACSTTPPPASPSRPTHTACHPRCDGSCKPATNTAGSPDAASPRSAARSITPTTTPSAARQN